MRFLKEINLYNLIKVVVILFISPIKIILVVLMKTTKKINNSLSKMFIYLITNKD